jgi:hypothetical protein
LTTPLSSATFYPTSRRGHRLSPTGSTRTVVALDGDVVVKNGKHADRQPFLMLKRAPGGSHGKTNQPEGLDRRQLLASAVGVAVTSIVPATESARSADPVAVFGLSNSQTAQPPALNFCAATTRRLQEIAERNRIRAETGLPLLSIPKELRRIKEVADAAKFEASSSAPAAGLVRLVPLRVAASV